MATLDSCERRWNQSFILTSAILFSPGSSLAAVTNLAFCKPLDEKKVDNRGNRANVLG
jgi:hypothetical protein